MTTAMQTMPQNRILALEANETQYLEHLEAIAQESQIAMSQGGQFIKAITTARAIKLIRECLNDGVMQDILPLMNTPLGFKTDKDSTKKVKDKESGQWEYPKPYPINVVRDCVIVATLRGAALVGNEFNIIAGQTYLTKEFFTRVLGQLPGVTNIVESPGLPIQKDGKTVVRFGLSWKKDGVADCLKGADGTPGRVFEINANQYSGADQIIGKATRKAYAAAYRQITGSQLAAEDGDVTDMVDGQVVPSPPNGKSELADKMAAVKSQQQQVTNPAFNGSTVSASPATTRATERHATQPASPPPAAEGSPLPEPAAPDASATGGAEPAESLESKLAAMPPDQFERELYAKARETYGSKISRVLFEGGMFKFCMARKVGELSKLPASHWPGLWRAVLSKSLDFATGNVVDTQTGEVADPTA